MNSTVAQHAGTRPGVVLPSPSASPGGEDPNVVYSLGSSEGETARLQRQADELAPDSRALLDRVGLRPGHSAIDLGCGPAGILGLLAERVSLGGRVVGVDADPAHTALAAEFAAARGLTGVEVITADARHTGLPSGSFDLVHTRTLLITVPDPARVVAEMVRLARRGGQVVAMEPDTAARAHLDDPGTVLMPGVFFLVSPRNRRGSKRIMNRSSSRSLLGVRAQRRAGARSPDAPARRMSVLV